MIPKSSSNALGLFSAQGGGFAVDPSYSIIIRQRIFSTTRHLVLDVRFIDQDGKMQLMQQDVATNGVGAREEHAYPCPYGYIVSVSVYQDAPTIQVGQAYASVSLQKGTILNSVPIQHFCHGYVYQDHAIGWPVGDSVNIGGRDYELVDSVIADPAAGSNFSFSPPVNSLVGVNFIGFTLVTDATVSNRYPSITFTDPNSFSHVAAGTRPILASSTAYISFGICFDLYSQYQFRQALGLPSKLLLSQYWSLSSSIVSLQSGDQISDIYIQYRKYFN